MEAHNHNDNLNQNEELVGKINETLLFAKRRISKTTKQNGNIETYFETPVSDRDQS